MSEEASQSIGSGPLRVRILLLETDEGRGEILRGLLRNQECRVRTASQPEEARELLAAGGWDAVFCDIRLSQVLPPGSSDADACPVFLLAPYDGISRARELVEQGVAMQWVPSPIRAEKLLQSLRAVLGSRQGVRGGEQETGGDGKPGGEGESGKDIQRHFGLMVGESGPMRELYHQIEKVADSDMSVLILGESGTGKELVAKAIHQSGRRAGKPFIPVNCASLPENLLESELFGYVKGAFTGAVRDKDGLFVAADGGTLFLDEIGSIPLATQMALLRALQEREVRPVGSTQPRPVDVRVVAATNENVEMLREQGRIRQDLFYRISAFPLHVPPLRERAGDLPLLCQAILEERSKGGEAAPLQLSPAARLLLERHRWPGNIRELIHVLERGATLAERGIIRPRDLPRELGDGGQDVPEPPSPSSPALTLKAYLRLCERQFLKKVLEEQGGDKEKAAKILGISVATLYRKLSEVS
ncbi:MAG: sigma 54-interacting transcriptional regulator [Oligosphaeraceae bacterium]